LLNELCRQNDRIPIKNVISPHLGMQQALLMKASNYPEQLYPRDAKTLGCALRRELRYSLLMGSLD
jgi:hypothetical protein